MTNERVPRRRVDVVGTGRASATPDVVRLTVGVRCDGDDVSAALRESARRIEAIGAAAREQGTAVADISSTGAGVHPRYDRDGQRVIGFQSFHQLQVVVRSVDGVGTLVDAFAEAAGNALTIDSIALDLSDRGPLEELAREAAFGDARHKAEQYAALSGSGLGPVLAVAEGGVVSPGFQRNKMSAFAMDSAGSMPVEAGEHTVTASVAVTWALVDPAGNTSDADGR